MATPSLDIALGSPDIEAFKGKMNEASNHVGSVARQIAKKLLDSNEAIKDGLLASASSMALGLAARAAMAYGAFKILSEAIGGARDQMREMVGIAEKSQNLGLSPQFFQAFLSESRKLKIEAGELESALSNAFSATKEKSPIDIDKWETGKERITEVEKALRVYNEELLKPTGQRLEGLVLFRDADTQERKVVAVLEAMKQLEQIGQRAAALDLGEHMFGSQLMDRIRQGRTSVDGILTTIKTASGDADGIFSDTLVRRAKDMDEQLKIAHQRLSTALKPSWDELAGTLLTIKGYWADTIGLIAKAVELSNSIRIPGFSSVNLEQKRAELDQVNAAINGTGGGLYGTVKLPSITLPGIGKIMDPSQEKMEAYRDQLQREIADMAKGDPYGPGEPIKSRGTGAAPTRKPTGDTGPDKLETAEDNIAKRTAALKAEAAAIDLGTAAREKAKIVAQLETIAKQANAAAGKGENVVTDDQRRKIDEIATAYAGAAKAMEQAKVSSSIKFDSKTALLDPSDVAIARELKEIYPDVATALNSVEAAAMRGNEAMKSVAGTMSSTMTTGFTDILDGTKSVSQGFADMGKAILRALEEALVKMLIVGPIMRSLGGGLGFADGGLIGSSIQVGSQSFPKFAVGGEISGPGTGRSDSIVARVSDGEFITNAASTQKYLPLLHAINADKMPKFADGGLVSGGPAAATPIAGGGTTVQFGDIHVNGGTTNGSPTANREQAALIASQIREQARAMVGAELRQQMRPGGLLRP